MVAKFNSSVHSNYSYGLFGNGQCAVEFGKKVYHIQWNYPNVCFHSTQMICAIFTYTIILVQFQQSEGNLVVNGVVYD